MSDTVSKPSNARRAAKAPGATARTDRLSGLERTLAALDAEEPELLAALRVASMVRDMRVSAGMSQTELGKRIGVSQARISEIEAGSGRQGPTFLLMERIAKACGMEINLDQQPSLPARRDAEDSATVLSPLATESAKDLPAPADVDAVAKVKVGGKSQTGIVQVGTFSPLEPDLATQNIRIRLKAFDHRVLDQATGDIADTARRSGALIRGPIPLPTKIEKFTVSRGPHIDKKSREQFEVRTYKKMLDIIRPTRETLDALIKLSLAKGVDIDLALGTQVEGLAGSAPASPSGNYTVNALGLVPGTEKPASAKRLGRKSAATKG